MSCAGHGVEVVGPAEGRNGVVVSLVSDGDRTMASDRGVAPELRPEELEPDWFRCDALHLSGYSLHREPMASAALRAATLARAGGASVSIDLAAWTAIDDAFRARLGSWRPTSCSQTSASGRCSASSMRPGSSSAAPTGSSSVGESFPAVSTEVVDPTGAGDALAGGFLVGGAQLGLEAAARCCAKLGTMP